MRAVLVAFSVLGSFEGKKCYGINVIKRLAGGDMNPVTMQCVLNKVGVVEMRVEMRWWINGGGWGDT